VDDVSQKPNKTDPKSAKLKLVSSEEEFETFDDIDLGELGLDFEPRAGAGKPPPPDAKPNPVELPTPINPEGGRNQSVEMHRNLFCVHYDACLDVAVKESWNSFTCIRCAFYHTKPDEEGGVEGFATQRRST
jgi:hypothetical protein